MYRKTNSEDMLQSLTLRSKCNLFLNTIRSHFHRKKGLISFAKNAFRLLKCILFNLGLVTCEDTEVLLRSVQGKVEGGENYVEDTPYIFTLGNDFSCTIITRTRTDLQINF